MARTVNRMFTFQSEPTNGSDFIVDLSNTINLEHANYYELALLRGLVCFGANTISTKLGNNIFKYRISSTDDWLDVTIPDGCYDVDSLNNFVKDYMKAAGHYDPGTDTGVTDTADDIYYIIFGIDEPTGRVKITISGGYQLDISSSDIALTLGYTASTKFEADGTYNAPNPADLNAGISLVDIHCSLVQGSSYVNNTPTDVLASAIPSVAPRAFIQYAPANPIFLPVTDSRMNRFAFSIRDQDGDLVSTASERTTIQVVLRATF